MPVGSELVRPTLRLRGMATGGVAAAALGASTSAALILLISRPPLLMAALAGLLAAAVTAVGYRAPDALPAVLVLVSGLIPYPVAVVGKTPFSVVSAIGGLAIVSFAAVLWRTRRQSPGAVRIEPLSAALAAWLFLLFCSAAFSGPFAKIGLNGTRELVIATAIAFWVGQRSAAQRRDALRWLAMAFVVLSALAIGEVLTGLSPYDALPTGGFPLEDPGPAFRGNLERVRLGYYHASDLGRVLVVGWPILLASMSGRRAWWQWGGLLSVPVALLLTLTFQSWIAWGVATLAFVAASPRAKGRRARVLAGAAVVLAAAAFVAPARELAIDRVQGGPETAAEGALRLALLPAAARHAEQEGLLGSGPRSFNLLGLTANVGGRTQQLVDDNAFTAQLIEVGYPGLGAFLIVLLVGAMSFFRRRKVFEGAAALGALAGWVTLAAAVDVLAGDQALLPAWIAMGVVSATRRPRVEEPADEPERTERVNVS